MIKDIKEGSIFNTELRHIAFPITTEGVNYTEVGKIIERKGFNKLSSVVHKKLGSVVSMEIDGINYYGLVTHSLRHSWQDHQDLIIKECFDKIKTNEDIATVAIGTDYIDVMTGADFYDILYGMYKSSKNIIMYSEYDYGNVLKYCMQRDKDEEFSKKMQLQMKKNR